MDFDGISKYPRLGYTQSWIQQSAICYTVKYWFHQNQCVDFGVVGVKRILITQLENIWLFLKYKSPSDKIFQRYTLPLNLNTNLIINICFCLILEWSGLFGTMYSGKLMAWRQCVTIGMSDYMQYNYDCKLNHSVRSGHLRSSKARSEFRWRVRSGQDWPGQDWPGQIQKKKNFWGAYGMVLKIWNSWPLKLSAHNRFAVSLMRK